MQNSVFIAQEISQDLGFFKKSVRKQDCFFCFLYIKTFRKKDLFVDINENYNDYHQ